MASLTETAYYTRRAINWTILALIGYFILRLSWGLTTAVWLAVFPPKPPPPNHAFGKLPKLQFPTPSPQTTQMTFKLETIEGGPPAASAAATVYFMPKTPANLLAITRTQEFAERLGFNPNPIAETKNIYRFEDPGTTLRRLRYDIVSNNFVLRYAFEQNPELFTERNLPSNQGAIAESNSMLQTYNLLTPDLRGGIQEVTYLRFTENQLRETTSLSQADAVRVDFFRRPIAGISVYTPTPDEGPVSFVFSGSSDLKKRLLQFAYTFWPVDEQTSATYAIKPTALAWQELENGGGYIARYPRTGTVATVRTVTLGYYDAFEPQTYLQPIFVFEGDSGFLAYVPAVAAPWTE